VDIFPLWGEDVCAKCSAGKEVKKGKEIKEYVDDPNLFCSFSLCANIFRPEIKSKGEALIAVS
jgi:hypothetical protein